MSENISLYDRVERVLCTLQCDVGAAECHGILCGMFSGPGGFDLATWLRQVSGCDDIGPYSVGEPYAAFEALKDETYATLAGDEFDFTLVLPADEAPLTERAGAFSAWCRGFLAGLGLAGIADLDTLGEDAREFLADVQRFGALSVAADSDEDNERALVELTEFTRVGVLLIRGDLRGDEEPADPRLH